MGSLVRRLSTLEDHIERQVQARLEAELDAVLDVLKSYLSREEFIRARG